VHVALADTVRERPLLLRLGWLHGLSTTEAADQIIGRLRENRRSRRSGLYTHAYRTAGAAIPVDLSPSRTTWFIDRRRDQAEALEGESQVEWVPEDMGNAWTTWRASWAKFEIRAGGTTGCRVRLPVRVRGT